jgi:transposase
MLSPYLGMADGNGCEVFTDAAWAIWEPLIEEVRPRGKTPPKDLRRTISAIFWRHQNGAKWRSIPAELGPWWLAAQLFIRWAKQGVWERLLELVQQRGIALGMTFIDGTNIRAHQKAAGAKKGMRQPGARCARGAWPLSRWLRHQGLRDRRWPRPGDCLRPGARTGA